MYIANLPLSFKENDVEGLLAQYGQVISTRILRDTAGQSKGVGFARLALFEFIIGVKEKWLLLSITILKTSMLLLPQNGV